MDVFSCLDQGEEHGSYNSRFIRKFSDSFALGKNVQILLHSMCFKNPMTCTHSQCSVDFSDNETLETFCFTMVSKQSEV